MRKVVKEVYFDETGIVDIPKYELEDGTILQPVVMYNNQVRGPVNYWFTQERIDELQEQIRKQQLAEQKELANLQEVFPDAVKTKEPAYDDFEVIDDGLPKTETEAKEQGYVPVEKMVDNEN